MVRNAEKLELVTYYRKRGFSYAEIAKLCGVSKGTVSNWLAKKRFSKQVRIDNEKKAGRENAKRIGLLNKARTAERTTRYREAVRSAETEFKHYKTSPQFIAGLMLYLESGDTSNPSQIRLSSQSETAHRIFQTFLKEFFGVTNQDITFWLLLPASVSRAEAEVHWSKLLKRAASTFGKTQTIALSGNTLHNGTGNTIIGSTVLKCKLTRWLELATKELAK